MTVCYTHGGNAPQVRAAARLPLALLVTPSLRGLSEIIMDKEPPAAAERHQGSVPFSVRP
jgi:hypothetical protein